MLTRLIVIILQYIEISNHYVVYPKLMLFVDYTSIKKKTISFKKKKTKFSFRVAFDFAPNQKIYVLYIF